jgi:hypothetical protein
LSLQIIELHRIFKVKTSVKIRKGSTTERVEIPVDLVENTRAQAEVQENGSAGRVVGTRALVPEEEHMEDTAVLVVLVVMVLQLALVQAVLAVIIPIEKSNDIITIYFKFRIRIN